MIDTKQCKFKNRPCGKRLIELKIACRKCMKANYPGIFFCKVCPAEFTNPRDKTKHYMEVHGALSL